MGKIIFVTGGARSGKSSFAEGLAKSLKENVLYVATSIPFDEEMKNRIKKHMERRPKEWKTLEAYKDLDICIKESLQGVQVVLIDCITIMVSNIMLEKDMDWKEKEFLGTDTLEKNVICEIDKLLKLIQYEEKIFIIVTNEIGMGIVPDNALSRMFRDIAGRVNQILANKSDETYFIVSGIPIKIK